MQPLPTETRSLLRSTQILTTLPQITSELVQNALDAGAHKVEIGVHFAEWTCWVRDDGSGISKDGLAALSERNRRYRCVSLFLLLCSTCFDYADRYIQNI
jgi:DNA mismatch repair protein MLH3